MGRSQREKGKRGERQAAAAIQAAVGLHAARGAQHRGGKDSPDIVVAGLSSVHFEVKHVERESIRTWMAQAIQDSGGKVPVLLHRRNGDEWLVTVQLGRLCEFQRELAAAIAAEIPPMGAEKLPSAVSREVLPPAGQVNE